MKHPSQLIIAVLSLNMKKLQRGRNLLMQLKTFDFLVVCCLAYLMFIDCSLVSAQGSLDEGIDCTDVKVNYVDNPNLTREERLRLMDKAFFESLNRFELCQAAKDKARAAAAGGGGYGGDEGFEGEAGSPTGGESVASTQMSGTEPIPEYPPAEGFETLEPKPLQSLQDIEEEGSKTSGAIAKANGKIPDDIPPAKNDDALAAQIRYAAENEPDPEKSRQLWNEYRKYKGLPTK
jgi:hypothetical protein